MDASARIDDPPLPASAEGGRFVGTVSTGPIRGELFSTERLERLAESLASEHVVYPGQKRGRRLLLRLRDNEKALLQAHRSIAAVSQGESSISPAAEWFLNNFHIVEEQIREVREDLPAGFYRELPKLSAGPMEGYPRVYALACAFIEHTDSRIDSETLARFVRAYQRVQPLTIGELWAIAISLRLVLVENLRRLAERIARRRVERDLADTISDALLATGGRPKADPAAVLRDLDRQSLTQAFAVQLAQRLREEDPAVTPALDWLDRQLARQATTSDEIVRVEHQAQIATHASVQNVITSMRLISSVDWAEFFESVSLVEQALRQGTRVAEMDFPTRDRYRRAVEELSRGSGHSELEVARRVVELAHRMATPSDPRLADPGYYLISKGRPQLERELEFRLPARDWLRRAWFRAATPFYLATIAVWTVAILAVPVLFTALTGAPVAAVIVLALLALVPASDLAVSLINGYVTELVGPRRFAKLELAGGVPQPLRTLVAVPMLLSEEAEIREVIERLEVHYLANPDAELRFALLSDWSDAPAQSMPEDEALLEIARAAIGELNDRHGAVPGGGDRFLVLHRRRVWNEGEGVWMGWERKRGKLRELNRLLRGVLDTSFLAPAPAVLAALEAVRYVITLDADTRLPRDAARRLVGTIAHPLNLPVFDSATGRVVEGHAVLQPRVTPTLPETGLGTLYQLVFSGPRGIDPYAFAVSDVYQDLFGEGIFTGKGIYDVDAFERALDDRVPENIQLSHDLFEGLFARAGFVSDVELFEGYPGHYEVAASRQHRWTRGDWQLLPWIIGRIPGAAGRRLAKPIAVLGRWKMFDNLRRSLWASTAFATLAASWLLPGVHARIWTLFLLAVLAFPPLLSFGASLILGGRRGIAKRSLLRGIASDLAIGLFQAALRIVLLAHQAWLRSDAILRTLWRLAVTHRHLLEWVPAAQAHRALDLETLGFYRRLQGGVWLAAAAGALAVAARPNDWYEAAPFVVSWLLAPAVARWVSLPPQAAGKARLSETDVRGFRLIARRTWRYFECFAGPEHHSLPADNFQELPKPEAATRTSPTNMGLCLLSTIAANDLGWIGTGEMVHRLDTVISTIRGLERFRGHFYNWYDTTDLRPLEPKYVSTVDSGNLAGHLIALRHACLERLAEPPVTESAMLGIADTIELLRQSARPPGAQSRESVVTLRHLEEALREAEALVSPIPASIGDWTVRLERLSASAATIVDIVRTLAEDGGDPGSGEALEWALALAECVASHRRDAESTGGWIRLGTRNAGEDIELPREALEILGRLEGEVPSLESAPDLYEEAVRELSAAPGRLGVGASGARLEPLVRELERAAQHAAGLVRRLSGLARIAAQIVEEMDFAFLYDRERKLFSLGYRVSDGRLDRGHYDLLASEARLASFVAIALGHVPAEHWFHLGRPLTPVGRGSALVSWSGSMFEYLMPSLVLDAPSGSLIEQSDRLAVRRQIVYGEERGIPWGVSEAAYNVRDANFTYQYSNFGVSGLGLKRGLSEDVVVAPYATALAAMVEPAAAMKNFQRLAEIGALGRYGYYESIDFTSSRLPEGKPFAVVRAYMAHHQGMTVVALDNLLLEGVMQRRFRAEPAVQATELLLQERTPRTVAVARVRAEEVQTELHVRDVVPPVLRRFRTPHDLTPRTHLLSNGRYTVMVTAAGSGYSRWRGLDVTRWREDTTRDPWGTYVFLRDVQSEKLWSAGYQPAGVEADSYEAVYSEDRVHIRRRDGPIATGLQIVVSAEDDAEMRQISLQNLGTRVREIELTSYAELVLASSAADAAHPAFSNLFVRTEFVPGLEGLLAGRRPRSEKEQPMWAAHVMAVHGDAVGAVQYETDRARFLGRGRGIRRPTSLEGGRPLSNTVGDVLDPIFSLRRRLRLLPGATARVYFSTAVAATRGAVLALAAKYREPATFERMESLAWTNAQVQLRHLGISPDESHLFQRLATRIIYSDPTLRAPADVLKRNRRGPSALWRHGISGDTPIVLVRIDQVEDQDIVRQLLRAHEYWRLKGLAVDLVIINEQPTAYISELEAALGALIRAGRRALGLASEDSAGGVFLLRGELLSSEERDALMSAARVVLLSRHGSLSEQVVRLLRGVPAVRPPQPVSFRPPAADIPPPRPPLEFFNGLGGFADDGREYVTILGERQWTPAPWVNVLANSGFGCLVSESGGGYTWAANSRQNQLTPWSNDPLSDPPGEALLVRDDDSGETWSPTALPIRGDWPYLARHGQGYSRFEHESRGIGLELLVFVARADPIKVSRLSLENRSARARRLTVTAYAEWVLGPARAACAPFVVTERDVETGALFARNPWNEEYSDRVAFADLGGRQTSWTADRTEFLGRNGALEAPAGLAEGATLSRRAGAGLDPCAALQTELRLAPGERGEVVFLLGQGSDGAHARRLVTQYRSEDLDAALAETRRYWEDTLAALRVRTPDRSMDLMVNRWLLYQTLACRVLGRSAFYQSGGAYGFRDQLQDVMALVVSRREVARAHLLRAASRQFREGDVLHWWHEPSGKGVRTRISDDRLWLPYATLHYMEVTGDRGVLDEPIPFLQGDPLQAEEIERYFEPQVSTDTASLFEHCARALDHSLSVGRHGLPLMGTGDWNDGMNRVGAGGKGESVWLGWFLHTNLWEFANLAEGRGEGERATKWRAHVDVLKTALEREGWDGDWYRRAFFDDGTPLGSASNDECRIDSIAQSWGVLSGAADGERRRRAMAAVDEYLIRRGDGLVLLFTPPFDRTALEPGYIKAYVPGVRENGGQYTHAAIWAAIAFAALGDGDKAGELFSILNPINHASTRSGLYRYKVEPYVAAADIYSAPPHLGRGGWTWYTGSAGWMYRAAVEWILGFRLRGTRLHVDPCIPRAWPGFEILFRYHSARYRLTVENPHGVTRGVKSIALDEEPVGTPEIPLADDGRVHRITVVLG